MIVENILKTIMEEQGMKKAELGRAVGLESAKASDLVNKRMKQKNISVNVLGEMLAAMGYDLVVVKKGANLPKNSYIVGEEKGGKANE